VPLQGMEVVEVNIADGMVDLSGVVAKDHPVARRWAQGLRLEAKGVRWALENLLEAMYSAGKPLRDFFRQLVLMCGQVIDDELKGGASEVVMGSAVAFGAGSAGDSAGARASVKSKLVDHLRRRLEATRAERRLKYYLNVSATFSDHSYYSLAIDATRMGQKNVISSFVALPSGECAVCPPQVVTHAMSEHCHA
jgi:hypothetical protein